MRIRRFLFLSLGLERVYPPQGRKHPNKTIEKLIEPDGARVCRRNILALAGVVVLAGAIGANPRDLVVLGVKPSNDWGVLVLGSVTVLAHIYWYVLRYYHMKEDARIEQYPAITGANSEFVKIEWNDFLLVRRSADLFSNRAAFLLTGLSWLYLMSWIVDKSPG